MDYTQQDPSAPIPTRNLDLGSLDINLLEPVQPEEELLGQYSEDCGLPGGYWDVLDPNSAQRQTIYFQRFAVYISWNKVQLELTRDSFVAIEFGQLKSRDRPKDKQRAYIFTLFFELRDFTSWIHVRNQTGTLKITQISRSAARWNRFLADGMG